MKNKDDRLSVEVNITFYYKRSYKKTAYNEEGEIIIIHREGSVPSLLTGDFSHNTTIRLKPEAFIALEKAANEKSGDQTDFDYLRKTNKNLYDEIMDLVLSKNPDFRKVILREFPSEVLNCE